MPEPGASTGDQGGFGGSSDMERADRDRFSAADMFSNPFGPIGYGLGKLGGQMFAQNPDGSYGYTDPAGFSRREGDDRRGRGARGQLPPGFQEWLQMQQQQQGAPRAPQMPATIDYAKAVAPGVSPAASAPLYGAGSPFMGPADIFGGV